MRIVVRRLLSLALTAAVLLLAAGGGVRAQAVGDEDGFVAHLTQERAARGLPGLTSASDLRAVARRHAQRMADRGEPFHNPTLTSEVEGWTLVGENVGFGPEVGVVHDAFMASAPHRSTILDPRFTEVGVGTVRDSNGRLWVVEVFRRPEASAPAPDPVTASAPPPLAPRPASPPPPTTTVPPTAVATPPPTVAPPAPTTTTSTTVGAPATVAVPLEGQLAGHVVTPAVVVAPDLDDLATAVPAEAWIAAFLLASVVALQGQTLRRLGRLP